MPDNIIMECIMTIKKTALCLSAIVGMLFLVSPAWLNAADDATPAPIIKELPDGSLYSGDLKYEVIREGKGTNEWPNGDRYRGEWLNDHPHGEGYLIRKNKQEYRGKFAFGQFSGLGDLKTASGDRYLGYFRFNQLDGPGLLITSNDEYYLGEFSQGKRHGRILYFASLSDKPQYQLWFEDELDKNVDMLDPENTAEQKLMKEMIASISQVGQKRLKQRKANMQYRVRGRVRKIVNPVAESPQQVYADYIINLLDLK